MIGGHSERDDPCGRRWVRSSWRHPVYCSICIRSLHKRRYTFHVSLKSTVVISLTATKYWSLWWRRVYCDVGTEPKWRHIICLSRAVFGCLCYGWNQVNISVVIAAQDWTVSEYWSCCYNPGVHRFIKKIKWRLKILGTRRVTWIRFLTEDSQLVGASVVDLDATATWGLGFVHPCYVPYIGQ
jgi:hypothetical protein